MFAGKLRLGEQEAFLDLAMICAKSNGELSYLKKDMLERYCFEMDKVMFIDTAKYDSIIRAFGDNKDEYEKNIQEIFYKISESKWALRIIFFELVRFTRIDKVTTDIEADILCKLRIELQKDIREWHIVNTLERCAIGVKNTLDIIYGLHYGFDEENEENEENEGEANVFIQ